MRLNLSGVKYSSIVSIGEAISKNKKENGNNWIESHRGVNNVTNIDLSKIISKIDFNSKEIQQYAPNLGIVSLRDRINEIYFPNIKNSINDISIISGGMPGLDIILQILNIKKIHFPYYYWGSYSKMANIRNKSYGFYKSLDELSDLSENDCVFICTPSNPTGIQEDKILTLNKIKELSDNGCTIILDCPYYKLFNNDNFFEQAIMNGGDNIIISESFSKCYGLSGIRLGFIYTSNKEFNKELNIRLLYEFNSISTVSQLIIEKLISTNEGVNSISKFQNETVKHIKQNIEYLSNRKLLSDEIYNGIKPIGIFAIINKTEEYLFSNNIGSVGLDKFCDYDKPYNKLHSRICVSFPNDIFKSFFDRI